MTLRQPKATGHRVRWFVRFPGHPDDWTPATAGMVRSSFGWDVRCSCGWETNTGGGTPGYVEELIWSHKFDHRDPEGDERRCPHGCPGVMALQDGGEFYLCPTCGDEWAAESFDAEASA
jgi:hypothetical protein